MRSGKVNVPVGDLQVARVGSTLQAVGVGSCVAIVLLDPHVGVGGIAHALLPDPARGRSGSPPARFASTAVTQLLRQMEIEGAARGRIHAWLVGGASMFQALLAENGRTLGRRNIDAARAALKSAGVPIRGEDVGGGHGRSIFFPVAEGRIRVTSVRFPDVVLS